MGRNNVEYKGQNLSRRDLFETICYDNAYHVLEYIKHFYNTKKCKAKPYVQFKRLYNFLEFLYDKNDMKIFDVDEVIAEEFMYHMANRVSLTEVYAAICKISCFYDYLLINKLVYKNPFTKVKTLSGKADCRRKLIRTNFITDEQIEKIKCEAPLYLKVYAMFSLSSGADIDTMRGLRWEHINFNERIVQNDDEKFFFSEYVSELLKELREARNRDGLNDFGYVFRSHTNIKGRKIRLSTNLIGEWCYQLGKIIDIPNLRHLDFRHTAIKRFLAESGSIGMTSVIMNHKFLSTRAKYFIVEENNNDLLQEYKDLCEI